MPKIEFNDGFKKKSAYDYPKLSLEQNEKARVCVIDSPTMEYVHNLRKVVTENGQPIMETQKYGRNFEKTREVPATEFVGKYLCLGDSETLAAKDTDPNNCPACKAALEHPSAIEAAKRRFVVHVIKYHTTKGTFNVQKPFQIELVAWEFAEGRFGQLVDIVTEHGQLPQIDLCLGPCTNQGYQKYDIIPGGSCQWGADEERKAKTREVVAANRSEDLTPLLGKKVTPAELRSQVTEIVQQYNYAFGISSEMPAAEPSTNAEADLSALLDEPPTPPATQTESPTNGDLITESPQAQQDQPPAKKEPPADEIEDLESLLSGL